MVPVDPAEPPPAALSHGDTRHDRHAGRLALVVGGATDIGRAVARRLAQDGARIALLSAEADAQAGGVLRPLATQVMSYRADVTDPDGLAQVAGAIGRQQGRVDILINAATIAPRRAWANMTFAEWRRVLAVDLDSLFLAAKAFVPAMQEAGWGRVVNFSSAVVRQPLPDLTHAITGMMGVIGFTRALATEVGEAGVTVNAIAPSLLESGSDMPPEDERRLASLVEAQAIKRPQRPEDIAGTASFLASDDAAFVTGQTFQIDGGLIPL